MVVVHEGGDGHDNCKIGIRPIFIAITPRSSFPGSCFFAVLCAACDFAVGLDRLPADVTAGQSAYPRFVGSGG